MTIIGETSIRPRDHNRSKQIVDPGQGAFRDPLVKVRAYAIASMLVSGVKNRQQIAEAIGSAPGTVDTITQTDEFKGILDTLVARHTNKLLDCVCDERAEALSRRASLEAKTLTLAGKVVARLNSMLDNPAARLGEIRAGIEAASRLDKLSPHAVKRESTVTHISFNPSKTQAAIIRQAREEAGLSMVDVLDVTPADAEASA